MDKLWCEIFARVNAIIIVNAIEWNEKKKMFTKNALSTQKGR